MAVDAREIWGLADVLSTPQGGAPRTMAGTVDSVDDQGTAWVSVPGSDAPVPAAVIADAEPGDVVTVTVADGRAAIEGNATSPAATVRGVGRVDARVDAVQADVADAAQVAEEAAAVASATNQHFWARSTDPYGDGAGTGAFVTDEEQADFLAAIAAGTAPTDARPLHNILMNSLGILLRTAIRNLVSITRSAVAFYDGLGNTAANVTALFGSDGFQVGSSSKSHLAGDYHSLRMVDKEGNGYLHVSDLRDVTGTAEIVETVEKTSTTQTRYDLSCTVAGDDPTSSDPTDYDSIVVELWDGYTYTETGDYTLGYGDTANVPYHYVIPGSWASSTQIVGIRATYLTSSEFAKAYTLGVRGDGQVGAMSFAHGSKCVASGAHSGAGGYISRAKGFASHASGSDSEASGFASHAFGVGLKSTAGGGLAIGRYNDATNNPLFSIGNGTSDANRSNALAIDISGNVTCGAVNGVDVTAIPIPQSGVVATRSVSAGSSESVSITFSEEFAAAPNVICGLQSTQTQLMGNCSCVVTARSTTGFTVALVNNSSSARNIGCYWIAL